MFINEAGSTAALNSVTITGGSAPLGGGISNAGGLTLNQSTITGNQAVDGGGIYNAYGATLKIQQSTLSGNSANWEGGGIYNYGANATITQSTINNNTAPEAGAGIANDGGNLVLVASTLSGNQCLLPPPAQPPYSPPYSPDQPRQPTYYTPPVSYRTDTSVLSISPLWIPILGSRTCTDCSQATKLSPPIPASRSERSTT